MKCKAVTKQGKPCDWSAAIKGYCMTHFDMNYGVRVPKICQRCEKNKNCRTLNLGKAHTCPIYKKRKGKIVADGGWEIERQNRLAKRGKRRIENKVIYGDLV